MQFDIEDLYGKIYQENSNLVEIRPKYRPFYTKTSEHFLLMATANNPKSAILE